MLEGIVKDLILRVVLADTPRESPESVGPTTYYPRKLRVRIAGLLLSLPLLALCASALSSSPRELLDPTVLIVFLILLLLGVAALSLASGQVSTDASGLRKTVLGLSWFVPWEEFTLVRFDAVNRAIKITAGRKNLKIDNTFVGVLQLLEEVMARTGLKPWRDGELFTSFRR